MKQTDMKFSDNETKSEIFKRMDLLHRIVKQLNRCVNLNTS